MRIAVNTRMANETHATQTRNRLREYRDAYTLAIAGWRPPMAVKSGLPGFQDCEREKRTRAMAMRGTRKKSEVGMAQMRRTEDVKGIERSISAAAMVIYGVVTKA